MLPVPRLPRTSSVPMAIPGSSTPRSVGYPSRRALFCWVAFWSSLYGRFAREGPLKSGRFENSGISTGAEKALCLFRACSLKAHVPAGFLPAHRSKGGGCQDRLPTSDPRLVVCLTAERTGGRERAALSGAGRQLAAHGESGCEGQSQTGKQDAARLRRQSCLKNLI